MDHDNADHLDGSVIASGTQDKQWTRLVNYVGIVQQAVRDVSAWAERGIAPPSSTRYSVEDGQVKLPADAATRRGVQPVVGLTADGEDAANGNAGTIQIRAGQSVTLLGTATMPPDAGSVVAAQWSATGTGDFAPAVLAPGGASQWTTSTTVRYEQPGTYYPVLRVSTQREANASDPFTHVDNLARVRVVVE